jgi:hypothetical protein
VTLSSGNTRQIGQIHAPDLIQREHRDQQQKAKTSSKNKRSRHDTWNARHARDTRSTNSAGKLTGSAMDTVPNKTKQARGTTTANTILVDSTKKKTNVGCDVLSCSHSHARAAPKNVQRKVRMSILIGMLRSKKLSCQF